jgi:hypothetical protein
MLSPSICFIFELHVVGLKSPTTEGFQARGAISELMAISIAERNRQRAREGQNAHFAKYYRQLREGEISWFSTCAGGMARSVPGQSRHFEPGPGTSGLPQ